MLVGAYLISIDAKNKMARERKERLKKEAADADPEAAGLIQNSLALEAEEEKGGFFLFDFMKSIWEFKAGLYIMAVSLLWYPIT